VLVCVSRYCAGEAGRVADGLMSLFMHDVLYVYMRTHACCDTSIRVCFMSGIVYRGWESGRGGGRERERRERARARTRERYQGLSLVRALFCALRGGGGGGSKRGRAGEGMLQHNLFIQIQHIFGRLHSQSFSFLHVFKISRVYGAREERSSRARECDNCRC